jgi:hypothetical protein
MVTGHKSSEMPAQISPPADRPATRAERVAARQVAADARDTRRAAFDDSPWGAIYEGFCNCRHFAQQLSSGKSIVYSHGCGEQGTLLVSTARLQARAGLAAKALNKLISELHTGEYLLMERSGCANDDEMEKDGHAD